jgi:hypothetical protein
VLLVGHDARRSAQETITLAAMAANNGLCADGSPMPSALGAGPASFAAIARESGLHIGAVRRGVSGNIAAGEAERDGTGFRARPEALATRWADFRRRIRLDRVVRGLKLRAEPLLLSGMVLGQSDQHGRLVLGRAWLADRLGWLVREGRTAGKPARRLDVARRAAERAGAIHSWTIPGSWQFCLARGPSRTRNRESAQTRNSESRSLRRNREPATRAIANPQREPSRTRNATIANAQQLSGLPSGLAPGSLPEPAPPAGDPIKPAQQQQHAPTALQQQSLGVDELRNRAGAWAVEMARRGIERLNPAIHAGDVSRLLVELGPESEKGSDAAALASDRRAAASRLAMWCPQPERLARWCVVAILHYHPANVAAYVRASSAGGDPGTLLERHAGGAGALLAEHEDELRGVHAGAAARLINELSVGRPAAESPASGIAPERLRVAAAAVLGDRRPVDDVARELGVPVADVEAAVEVERARRLADSITPKRRSATRQGVA